jgi:hypothetical protein
MIWCKPNAVGERIDEEAESLEWSLSRSRHLGRVEHEACTPNDITVFTKRGGRTIPIHVQPDDVVDVDKQTKAVDVEVGGGEDERGFGNGGEGGDEVFVNGLCDEDGMTPAHRDGGAARVQDRR